MSWEVIVGICEIVGVAVLIASLIYLSLQVRSQSLETRFSAMHDFSTGFRNAIANCGTQEAADIIMRGNKDINSLNDVEKFQMLANLQQIHRAYEEAFLMHRQGRLDEEYWEPMIRQYASFMGAPCFRYVWDIRKNFYNDDFRVFVDGLEAVNYQLDISENNI